MFKRNKPYSKKSQTPISSLSKLGGIIIIVYLIFIFITTNTIANARVNSGSRQIDDLDADKRAKIIKTVIEDLSEYYLDVEIAEKMISYIQSNLDEGKYDEFVELEQFLNQVTDDMREVSHDLHLILWPITPDMVTDDKSEEAQDLKYSRNKFKNLGFNSVKRLAGNIGYINLGYFEKPKYGGATAIAAMNFLAYSNALIFDLRNNHGGSPYMVNLLHSYFFDEAEITVTTYTRYTDTYETIRTSEYVPGPRMSKMPVYILMNSASASGAEGFAYVLKVRGKATIVGEKSRGAANMIKKLMHPELSFFFNVSISKHINPITGTSWEGTGIKPDIKVSADKALEVAYAEALKKAIESETDDVKLIEMKWTLPEVQSKLNPLELDADAMQEYVGTFDNVEITMENGALYYQRIHNDRYHLVPLIKDLFKIEEEERSWLRIRFERNGSGAVSTLITLYDDGIVRHPPEHRK